MAVSFSVRINIGSLINDLKRVGAGLKDLKPLMLGLDLVLKRQALETFRAQQDPNTGQAWKPLAERTLAGRRKGRRKGGGGARILSDTGALLASLVARKPEVTQRTVRIGSNLVYARIHQVGGRAGRGAIIPARPYIGIGPRQEQAIGKEVDAYFSRLFKGGGGGIV